MEPLEGYIEDDISSRCKVIIEEGLAHFIDPELNCRVTMTEDQLGKLFDKWMLARLAMNQRKAGPYEEPA